MPNQTTLAPASWRNTLSAKDKQAFAENGYLHIRAVAGQSALEAMRTAWARRLEAMDNQELAYARKRGNNDGPNGLQEEPAFRPCLEHPYVMGAVAEMLDGDVVLLSFRGRDPIHDSGQQGFHVDAATPVPADRQRMVNAFWVLDDMDESNGATRIIPGSHRLERVPGKELLHRDARHPEARSITARAGDVVVFSAHLWHAGSKNPSGAPRRIAMAHFGRREMLDSYAHAYRQTARPEP